jgi:hypothetical protein
MRQRSGDDISYPASALCIPRARAVENSDDMFVNLGLI